ncbi:flagellar hook protein FlgE [Breznakiella homolactica]|uniref:Flagellar hook protein FlgE n=1 Tax=Breznakiella homolactica TaxID=2798577 RepID=A0A7T8B867_9SPIR|nr:flagellar hook protein FlgE [Breznakiella homolactica]QQO08254.1 flagellar hook protein FlgE [Breznakiella homolactica]
MMRSMFSGVAGLQNHQTRMDVIGNNIANINTTGFKKNRVNFQDLLYQQLSGAARPTEDVGGVNPKEVGLGMQVASIDTIHTQGSLQTTGVGTDLAIQGTGFFVLKSGSQTMFTRAGAFGLDQNGTLVNPANGMRVQGWMAREIDGVVSMDVSREVEDLIIPVGSKDPARATTMVNFACNLDKRTPEILEGASQADAIRGTWGTEIKVYDSFGQEHIMSVEFTRVPGENNSWTATVTVDPEFADPTNTSVGLGDAAPAVGEGNTFTVNFSNMGTLAGVVDAAGNTSPLEGDVTMMVAFDVQSATPGEDGELVRQEFALNLGTVGGLVNTITQYAEASSTKAIIQDGYTMGYLENFKIDQNGTITGVYSNGTNRTIGQVALASFTNQGGLEKSGENNYVVSTNSGMANIGPARIAGKGKIIAGTLEMSNVDMAEQFTDMIITQRGFQANSKTIQTADQLLQELLTLKR